MAKDNDLVRLLLLIVAIALLLPVLMMVFAWPMMGMWGGGHMGDGVMWNGMGPGLWFVMWSVPLVILLGGGYLLYRAVARPDSGETDAALEELRLAYARGELTDEEFEQRRERLRREQET